MTEARRRIATHDRRGYLPRRTSGSHLPATTARNTHRADKLNFKVYRVRHPNAVFRSEVLDNAYRSRLLQEAQARELVRFPLVSPHHSIATRTVS